ncbi:MAG TPA: pyruvate:ferredoxin (flavodoxin) oxidoreductase [Planctomycetota bacterium]|nr:pyruvate:ferredoxin (flavodoxin) oxidoreductase [Planctomycetota bacterium]
MVAERFSTMDANEAVAAVAHSLSEVIAIYPITPSSSMGELADEWSSRGRKNLWGIIPDVVEMQSEGGAAGAVHGALQAGALSTTFTASQGLLLMIPNMYKIAGELTSFCMHVSARALATHALSIFGDHSDVMAVRGTGFALLCSNSVQEAQDIAAIAHASTLRARVPFLHFFDGFRTSHEVAKFKVLGEDTLRAMMDEDLIAAHRRRGLTPDRPMLRGTAENPDTFFQASEAGNRFHAACPSIVQGEMDRFAKLTGRQYNLVEYHGHREAERVIVIMGSGAETAHETVDWMIAHGEKVGVLKIRLYRPFPFEAFCAALPKSVRTLAVLDRCKEPGALGEPLYQDIVTALHQCDQEACRAAKDVVTVVGGRYGLASKEFTPAMVKSVFDHLAKPKPRHGFTVGILDDVTHLSLPFDPGFDIEPKNVIRAVFFGLGADGTVGANKNSIKIIGEETDNYAQGYFVYDSKKSGAITISHLRFGPAPIRSAYLVNQAEFVACHQFNFLERIDVVSYCAPKGVLLLNTPFAPDKLWDNLPREVQQEILTKKLRVYTIDAYKVARENGMGVRINTVMQTCFFAISGVLPPDDAIAHIKHAIEKTYGKKGPEVVRRNFAAVDASLAGLDPMPAPKELTSKFTRPGTVSDAAPDLVKRVSAIMLSGKGDLLPVSAFPVDGTWPTGTSQWEKRNIAPQIPVWDSALCIQCNKCAMVCPHAAIRAKVYEPDALFNAPETFKSVEYKAPDFPGCHYTIQVAPEDCTGCNACVAACPAKDKSSPKHKAIDMEDQAPLRIEERENYAFFLDLPEPDRTKIRIDVKGSQFFTPLFEYSGACAGCGETPYIKLLTQLYGDRLLIANATGCSSIYGGNLPTTPYCSNRDGRGPAWSNSLFEDNAEFGLGMRLAVDHHRNYATELLKRFSVSVGDELTKAILESELAGSEAGIAEQRARIAELRRKLTGIDSADARLLRELADYLVHKSIWIVGGDGWAYDIGYGGLDHVLASNRKINVLVLDTEVYSNTGGQASKSTPMSAAAKFAASGKTVQKKELGLLAISYGHVYVAQVAYGARDAQTVKAFQEAESYPGPSLIIAYSPCIAHGYDLALSGEQMKLAVDSGYWPLYRYDPRRKAAGEAPMLLDSGAPKVKLAQFTKNEARFRMVEQLNPEHCKELAAGAQAHINERFEMLERVAKKGVAAGTVRSSLLSEDGGEKPAVKINGVHASAM